MDMEKVIGYVREYLQKPIPPVPGKEYQRKPEGYRTFQSWLSLGYRPKNVVGDGMVFKMQEKPEGYTYFCRADVEPLTEAECKQLDAMKVKHGVVEAKKDRMFGGTPSSASNEKKTVPYNKTASNQSKSRYTEKAEGVYRRKESAENAGKKGKIKLSGVSEESVLKKFPNMAEIGKKTVYTINVETNGTDIDKDDVIRVVIVGKNENGYNGVLFQSMFHPINNLFWGKDEQEISHITPDMLDTAPFPKYLGPYLQQMLDSADYVSTYDAGFNLAFLKKSFGVDIPKEKVLDSKEIFKKHFPGEKSYKMGDAVRKYIPNGEKDYLEHQGKRDTEYDAKVMHALFEMERISIKNEQLAEVARMDGRGTHDGQDERER